jgi:hypothetical protein
MGNDIQNSTQTRTPASANTNPGIWLALAIALGLHALILLLPLPGQVPGARPVSAQIDLRLTTFDPIPVPEPLPEPVPEPVPEPRDTRPESVPLAETSSQGVSPASRAVILAPIKRGLETMNTEEKRRLTNLVLSSPFITEDSAADQLFGNPFVLYSTEIQKEFHQKEFHYPERPSLLAMLDQPMQELPFAYTPGLVRFAYDPGIKGDLQRFWDVITPEFGWTSKYGTEVKCVWVLVIAACGWK